MSLLLDTHVLLWWSGGDPRLGATARTSMLDADGDLRVSALSAWEMSIKTSLGRLEAPDPRHLLAAEGFRELAFTVEHAVLAGALPPVHRDPFDRGLVAQARAEGLTLVTADVVLSRYDVDVLDATS